MRGIVLTGWSALCSAGVGADALVRLLAATDLQPEVASPGVAVGGLCDEPLPASDGHALTDFDVRAHLGRKGTSFYDRTTALAVVGCQQALRDAELVVDDVSGPRVGVVLGTSVGSFKSTSDFSRETLEQDRPYLVNPVLFPNTVMNCAAGQVAIRFHLRGVNATIAGGALAFLNSLRYASNAIERGYTDVMLTGAVEEYSAHRAWAAQLTGATVAVPVGEAAAVFVLAGEPVPGWAGPRRSARLLAVATGYGPGGADGAEHALRACIERAVHRAGVAAECVTTVFTGEAAHADRREYVPTVAALGQEPRRIMVKRLLGECDAASGAVALAVLLATPDTGTADEVSLFTARGADGAVGAAIVRRCADDGTDRG